MRDAFAEIFVYESPNGELIRSDRATREQLLEMLEAAMDQIKGMRRDAKAANDAWSSLTRAKP